MISTDNFIKIECKNNLFDRQIENFYYWGYIRAQINDFCNIPNSDKDSILLNKEKNFLKKIIIFYKFIFNFINSVFIRPKYYVQKDILIFMCSQREHIKNKKRCRFTYDIIDHFKDKCNVISDSNYFGLENNYDDCSLDYFNFLIKINNRFLNINKKYKFKLDSEALLICKLFKLDSYIYKNKIINSIINSFSSYKIYKKFYFKLLKRSCPKLIIYQEHYNNAKFTLNEIAKIMKIETIELQHGVIGRGHIAYNFGKKFNIDILPNKVFFWGPYWKETCRFPIGDNNKLVVGFPYHDLLILNSLKGINISESEFTILIISQPNVRGKFINFTESLINKFQKEKISFKIIFKLHPKELLTPEKEFEKLNKFKNVTIINNFNHDIYYYLANSNIVIGSFSTVLFQATSFNNQIYIYNDDDYNIYTNDLVNEGYVTRFDDADELFAKITDKNNISYSHRSNNIFFSNNASKNILKYINNNINV